MDRKSFIFALFLSAFLIGAVVIPCFAEEKLNQIKERGVLNAATVDFPNAPFTFEDASGKRIGFDMDLIHALAEKLGVKVNVIRLPWESGITKCWDKDYKWDLFDIAAGTITIKPSRAAVSGFSVPYFTTGQTILTRKNGIKSKEDIKGQSVAVMTGSTAIGIANELGGKVQNFENYSDIVEALKVSIVPAAIMDGPAAMMYAKNDPDLVALEGLLTTENYGIAIPKGDEKFMELVNQVVEENKESLLNKWLK